MRFFSLVVVAIFTGVLSMEDICRYNAHEKCRVYSVLPYPLPKNEEDLRNDCLNLNRIKECILDNVKNCSAEAIQKDIPDYDYRDEESRERKEKRIRHILKDNQRLMDVATEICQEDSQLRSNLVSDMLCYREIFEINDRDQICMNYTTNAMNYLRSRLDKIRQERGGFSEHSYCLRVLFDLNCFVEQFNRKCSSLAKDTSLELIKKGGSLDDQCPVSIRLDILEFLDDLKVLTKQDIFVRQLLESER